jgi:hypothetical protein
MRILFSLQRTFAQREKARFKSEKKLIPHFTGVKPSKRSPLAWICAGVFVWRWQ